MNKQIDLLFDEQSVVFSKHLKHTQEQHEELRQANCKENQRINKVLEGGVVQRKQAHVEQTKVLEAQEQAHVDNNDVLNENPATTVSMLAPHRYKPYHFKGFS